MAWNDAWDADTVYIGGHDFVLGEDLPSVKHLIADLCNAINERLAAIEQSVLFVTAGGSSSTPAAADFVGLMLNAPGTGDDYKVLLQQIINTVEGMVDGKFHKSDWTDTWELSEALTAVGSAGLSVDRFREKALYEELRDLVLLCRYVLVEDVPFDLSGNTNSYYSDLQDTQLNGSPNTAASAWAGIQDNMASVSHDDDLTLSIGLDAQLSSPNYPQWYYTGLVGPSMDVEVTYSGPASVGTAVGFVGTISRSFVYNNVGLTINAGSVVEGTLGGASWEFTITPTGFGGVSVSPSSEQVVFTSGTTTFEVAIGADPLVTWNVTSVSQSTFPDSFSVRVTRIDARYDLNSGLEYT